MCELKELRDRVTDAETAAKIEEFRSTFDVAADCEPYEVERAARTSVALDKLVEAHRLGSMAYYYEGAAGNEYENIVTSVIAGNTLLTGRNIPVAGECEVKNAHAMKILAEFGAGGSFSEPYAMDFDDDVVLWGTRRSGAFCDRRRPRGTGAAVDLSRQTGQRTFDPDERPPRTR